MKVELIAIRNEADYRAARALLAKLMTARSAAIGARLRAQAALIAAYEAERVPPRPVDPVTAIRFRMEQLGLKQADLVPMIGTKSKVSEVLNRKRRLSLAMIRRLRAKLDIPADVLIGDAA
ncbi:MAG: transcriptional regulator [Alphaproteobacteria bacterium]|nr:transcriptional regulator [Alphaproteobacteria bacterium]